MDGERLTTKDILKILAVAGVVAASLAVPNLAIAFGAIHKEWKKYNRRDFGQIIKRLKKQEMISFEENDGKVKITVTEKGKRRLLEYDFEKLDIKAKKRDGKWRLIIFDIPEGQKRNRDTFRKKLLELGFIRVQDSVFACAFPCRNEVDFLCHFLDVSNYVTLLTVDRFERGEELFFKQYYYSE